MEKHNMHTIPTECLPLYILPLLTACSGLHAPCSYCPISYNYYINTHAVTPCFCRLFSSALVKDEIELTGTHSSTVLPPFSYRTLYLWMFGLESSIEHW